MKINIITTQDYSSLTLIVWCIKLKLKMFRKILVRLKKWLISVIVQVESNYYDSNKLVVGKMKDKTAGVAITEFVGLKLKIYSFLGDDSSEHKKAKGVNKNVVSTIIHT